MDIQAFFEAVIHRRADLLQAFFAKDAQINWHCSNERFSAEEYIRANCEYPGKWQGKIERLEQLGELYILAARVFTADGAASFHVVSFIKTQENKITSIDEYWGDDGPVPEWRLEKKIGRRIS